VVKGLFGFVLLIGAAAVTLPSMTTAFLEKQETPEQSNAAPSMRPATPAPAVSSTVELAADENRHFRGHFKINGRSIDGMIDTGATMVALNESTARRLGILPVHYLYKVQISTANGTVPAARVAIDRIEIGQILVREVDAVVLPDASLSSTLIGMSFLGQLASYRVEDGALHLVK
jgi:aspartyl protease family protein